MPRVPLRLIALTAIGMLLAACGQSPGDPRGSAGSDGEKVLTIGAIPDQDPQVLQRQFSTLSAYLGDKLGVEVKYLPVTDYTASVTAFQRGDLQLVFFGGLTGVQARTQVPGAIPLAQRDIDADFSSVFIANTKAGIEPFDSLDGLRKLAGNSFTFGSDTSTSGRLMPQHFLSEAGMSIDDFSGDPGYSGSHDKTAKLVEAGTYQTGALNSSVWDELVDADKIDTSTVREVFRTPPYHDYHWVARPDIDEQLGDGMTDKIKEALLGLDGSDATEKKILDMFQAGSFIDTAPGNYAQIEQVAQRLGLLN
ncbi:MAG: putative selenate ABC transporter substrate-binding protein [Actinophytocola sp.]|nr:putative selenate ABC transporter substrate-binding protein [Actinophytocola sp.]